jgi:hypothetical protein
MEVDTKMPLILGRPFLSTANAHIDVGAGEIQLNINGQTERVAFRPKVEQCYQVKAFNRKKYEKSQEKPSTPTIDILAELLEQLRIDREIRVHNYRNVIMVQREGRPTVLIMATWLLSSTRVAWPPTRALIPVRLRGRLRRGARKVAGGAARRPTGRSA